MNDHDYIIKYPWLENFGDRVDSGLFILSAGRLAVQVMNGSEELSTESDLICALKNMTPEQRLRVKARLREHKNEMYRSGAKQEAALVDVAIEAINRRDYTLPLLKRYESYLL